MNRLRLDDHFRLFSLFSFGYADQGFKAYSIGPMPCVLDRKTISIVGVQESEHPLALVGGMRACGPFQLILVLRQFIK